MPKLEALPLLYLWISPEHRATLHDILNSPVPFLPSPQTKIIFLPPDTFLGISAIHHVSGLKQTGHQGGYWNHSIIMSIPHYCFFNYYNCGTKIWKNRSLLFDGHYGPFLFHTAISVFSTGMISTVALGHIIFQ